jgi:hypothetical protein
MRKLKAAIIWFLPTDLNKKKNLRENAENFTQCFDFFQIFTISKIKTRAQIFPKIDKKIF